MSQATELKKQQDAQNIIYEAARTLYRELKIRRQQVQAGLELLQAENTSQSEKVKTLTGHIADTLTKQWEGMTNLLKTEATSIIEPAHKEFKEVNKQLVQLYEWTKMKIEQETQDRINTDTTIKEAGEAALKNIVSLKRKLRDPEDPLGTASTKRQRPPPDTTRHSHQQSEILPPAPTKKEPRNVPQPNKYNRSSAKLKAFLNDIATVFKRMPVIYETANDKILYIGALLTNSAKTWYLANGQKRKPDPLSGWTMWVTYEDFLKYFIAIHKNKNEVREAKRNPQMEYQKSGERIQDYVSRMRTHNMLTNLS